MLRCAAIPKLNLKKIQVGELRMPIPTVKSIHVYSVRSKHKKSFKNPLQNFNTNCQ